MSEISAHASFKNSFDPFDTEQKAPFPGTTGND